MSTAATDLARFADSPWIAVEWSADALRAWHLGADGTVLAQAKSGAGTATLVPHEYEAALLDLVQGWLTSGAQTLALCSGKAGAPNGWYEAGFTPVPSAPVGGAPVSPAVHDPRLAVRLLPGLSQTRPSADLTCGEEVRIAGFLAENPRFDGVICLPGIHTKWAQVSAGEVVSFRTFLTGEMFDLLATRSVLHPAMSGTEWDGDAFDAALDDAISRPETLSSGLFGLRAGAILSGLPAGAARARLLGLLIGAELSAARPYWLGQPVALVGAPDMCGPYDRALSRQAAMIQRADGADMALAGLRAARDVLLA